jgi:hypothetical protein
MESFDRTNKNTTCSRNIINLYMVIDIVQYRVSLYSACRELGGEKNVNTTILNDPELTKAGLYGHLII